MIFFLLLIYFSFILILSTVKPVHIPGKLIYLFRAFFPSWKFFEDIGEIPVLFYRVSQDENGEAEWKPCLIKSHRKPGSLILNSNGNYLLACESLIQQFVNDLQEMNEDQIKKIEESVSYQLIQNLVCYQAKELSSNQAGFYYQFKVSVFSQGLDLSINEDLLISPIYPVKARNEA